MENSVRDGNTRPLYLPPENLYAGQEATVRTVHETTDWFQIGKGIRQGCILSSCLFDLHAEYIMRNTGLEDQSVAERSYPTSVVRGRNQEDTMPGAVARRSYPTPEAKGGSWEELYPAPGQGYQHGGAIPHPRSSGCTGSGGPRGATPCSRSGGAAVRR